MYLLSVQILMMLLMGKLKNMAITSVPNNLYFLLLVLSTNGRSSKQVNDFIHGICNLINERHVDNPIYSLSTSISY